MIATSPTRSRVHTTAEATCLKGEPILGRIHTSVTHVIPDGFLEVCEFANWRRFDSVTSEGATRLHVEYDAGNQEASFHSITFYELGVR